MSDKITVIDEGNIIEIVQGGSLTIMTAIESGVEIEKLLFVQLADVPHSYIDEAGKTVRVNSTETGLEFGKSYDSFISLEDTPRKYASPNQLLAVNQDATGIRFINYTVGDINIEYFNQLADVPGSYASSAKKIVNVNEEETGLEYNSFDTLMPNQINTAGSYNYPKIVVDTKGRITAVQEGKPFEFPEFTKDLILVGDGTTTPAQIPNGGMNQVLTINSDSEPRFSYVSSLYNIGYEVLKTITTSDNSSTAILETDNSGFKIYPQTSNMSMTLGNGISTINVNGSLNILDGQRIQGTGISIDPKTGTVGIKDNVLPEVYSERIQDNDFITKYWFNSNKKDNVDFYKKSNSETISNNTVIVPIPKAATISKIYMKVDSAFNPEAALQVIDSNSQVILDAGDSPVLDYDNFEATVDSTVTIEDYELSISIQNYISGQGTIYIGYFEGEV